MGWDTKLMFGVVGALAILFVYDLGYDRGMAKAQRAAIDQQLKAMVEHDEFGGVTCTDNAGWSWRGYVEEHEGEKRINCQWPQSSMPRDASEGPMRSFIGFGESSYSEPCQITDEIREGWKSGGAYWVCVNGVSERVGDKGTVYKIE